MIRKHKKFSWPRKLYDKGRIEQENKLVEKYGLKNKREIWKIEARVRYLRNRAKKLITAEEGEKVKFFSKLNMLGFDVHSIAGVLALTKEDILKRRLSTIVMNKGLATTPKQARQMITHKRLLIKGNVVGSPSYLVRVSEENSLSVRAQQHKPAIANNSVESEGAP